MSNLTIGKRIIILASVLCGINIVVAAWSVYALSHIEKEGRQVSAKNLPGVIQTSTMNYLPMINMVRLYRLLETDDPAELKRIEDATLEDTRKFLAADKIYKETLTTPEELKQYENLTHVHERYLELRAQYLKTVKTDKQEAHRILSVDMVAALGEFSKSTLALLGQNADQGETAGLNLVERVRGSTVSLIVSGLGGVGLCVFLAVFTIRGTNSVLNRVASTLSEVSNNVSNAANQVGGASQTLAQGASEQAASLEETSASLEEINSQSMRNAENANNARVLAEDTKRATDHGTERMREMTEAMNAIKAASDNIAKIIKTIDEIAFQTNILALNAAVEAARAGEAGAGFAVVAEEVRNLAQRSAIAAKETAEKIDDSLRKSVNGVELSARVSEGLTDIAQKTMRMNELINEISTASREQTEGLKQVGTAVAQMDQVTQRNAASAEETASSATELKGQSGKLLENVQELLRLVGGKVRSAPQSA